MKQEEQRRRDMENFQRVLAQADALRRSIQVPSYRNPLPWTSYNNQFKEGGDTKKDKEYYEYMEKVAEENAAKWGMTEDETLLQALNDSTYNYRAYYEANKNNLNVDSDNHWPDTYKTAYHPTFSDESIYSGEQSQYNPTGETGGSWVNDILIPSNEWNSEVAYYMRKGSEPYSQRYTDDNVNNNTQRVYTVKAGDSLSKIAKKELGDMNLYKQIAEINNIDDPNIIKVGQELRLPDINSKADTAPKSKNNWDDNGDEWFATERPPHSVASTWDSSNSIDEMIPEEPIKAGVSIPEAEQANKIFSYLMQTLGTPLPPATGQQGAELGLVLDEAINNVINDPYGLYGSPDYNYTPPGKLDNYQDYVKWAFKNAKWYDKFNPNLYRDFLTFPIAAEDIIHKQFYPKISLTKDNNYYSRGTKMYAHALAQQKLDAIKDLAHGNMTYKQYSEKFEGANMDQLKDAVKRYKKWEKLPDDNKTPFNFDLTGKDYNHNYAMWDFGGDHHNYVERISTPLGLESTLGTFHVTAYPDSTVITDLWDSATGIDPKTGKHRKVPISVNLADEQGKKNIDKLFGDAPFKELLYPIGWLTTDWIMRYPQAKWGALDYDPDSIKNKDPYETSSLKK